MVKDSIIALLNVMLAVFITAISLFFVMLVFLCDAVYDVLNKN